LTNPQNIELSKKGEERGYAQLYKDCAPYVYSHVKRYIWDTDFRKDMMQEIFAKIFINIKKFDPQKGNFKGWIKRIAINECLQQIRKKRPLYNATNIEASFDLADETPLPTDLKRSDIDLLLKDMPPRYKVVFMLSIIDGYSHKEIGEQLNITEATSRSQLTRAKKWTKRYLLNNIQNDLYGWL